MYPGSAGLIVTPVEPNPSSAALDYCSEHNLASGVNCMYRSPGVLRESPRHLRHFVSSANFEKVRHFSKYVVFFVTWSPGCESSSVQFLAGCFVGADSSDWSHSQKIL
jgi:hypothetical protein